MTASFYKLKDDTWGIRIKNGNGEPGLIVEVEVKSTGKTKNVTLGKRVAKFDDAELWTQQTADTQPAPKPVAPAQLPEEEPF